MFALTANIDGPCNLVVLKVSKVGAPNLSATGHSYYTRSASDFQPNTFKFCDVFGRSVCERHGILGVHRSCEILSFYIYVLCT